MWNRLLSRSFDKWAGTYDEDISRSFARRGITYADIWEKISDALGAEENARLLEIGVGTGALGRFLKNECVTGLDISKGMLNEADRLGVYKTLIHASADRLPFLDQSFDGIYSSFMFHSERNPKRLLKECIRVLKPGCRLVVVDLFPRNREKKRRHRLWSNFHSLKYEKLAPSSYKPLAEQGDLFKKYLSDVHYQYIDNVENIHDNSFGFMSHGLIFGCKG